LVAKSIGDYSEGEFLKLELLKTNENSREMLENYCYLSGGSLLAHSCKSALLLAEFDEEIQCVAFDIGKYIGIAFQVKIN
jgi:geranylgeranyl pyrophosphate synthase